MIFKSLFGVLFQRFCASRLLGYSRCIAADHIGKPFLQGAPYSETETMQTICHHDADQPTTCICTLRRIGEMMTHHPPDVGI